MRPALRLLTVAVVAGTGLAFGLLLLVPEVRVALQAARAGDAEEIVSLTELSQRSIVYDREGNVMAAFHAEENRTPVALGAVPDHVVNAILDVEDDRFWHHGGVNLRSALRALVTNVQSGEIRQGGSTVTQQLVKNHLLTPEQSVDRKVKEAVLAVRLENELSKQEILQEYLNTVYFGNGAYGVQAAAERYFGRDVGDLTVSQAALLAGLIRNPVYYDPIKYPDVARTRRDLALDRMVANRHLDRAHASKLKEAPLPTRLVTPPPPPNDYFVEEVKRRLLDDKRLGETAQDRYNAVFRGGLHIHTTFDAKAQRAAEEAMRLRMPDTRGRFTSALASVEVGTGAVRAIFAGQNFSDEQYNYATQALRQPGSSFKIFVLLAALEDGYGPNDSIDGTDPCTIKLPGSRPYTPGNFSEGSGGVMTLSEATARSINCAYARLGTHIGLEKVVDMAARMGIPRSRLDAYPAMTLGTEEVTPLEMAAAYATIANDGVYVPPRFVEKVVDRHGRVVFEGPDKGRRAFSEQTARVAAQMMRRVVDGGTGTRARLAGRQVAGKTGTSQNHENAWFVGFTRELVSAVWMGSPKGNVHMRVSPCGPVTGGCIPAMIWQAYMSRALDGVSSSPFPAPDPKRIPRGKFIKDRYGSARPTTTTTSSTVPPDTTLPPTQQPTTTLPIPITTTTALSGGSSGGQPPGQENKP